MRPYFSYFSSSIKRMRFTLLALAAAAAVVFGLWLGVVSIPESVVVAPTQQSEVPSQPEPTLQSPQVGISVAAYLAGLSDAELDAELSSIRALGAGWIRIDLEWSTVQHHDAERFSWSVYDRIISAAAAHNLRVLPILLSTPAWARPGCDSDKCPPGDKDSFAAFAAAAAARYSKQGIHAWEIWNEQNMAGSWAPAADATEYARLLKAAYGAIKSADPSATVIAGGLGSVATGRGNSAPLEYLADMYSAGAGDYFDAVGFHPYSFPALPSNAAPWNAWQQMSATARSLRSIMAAHGDSGKKIWMTEYGAPTGGPGAISEAEQARMVADAVSEASGYAWAGPLFIYTYQDRGTAQDTAENFYGLLRYDGSKKPAFGALQRAISAAAE